MRRPPRKFRVAATAVVASVFLCGAGAVTAAALPVYEHYNVEGLRTAHVLRTIFPQGWAFFTKDPTEPRLSIFSLDDGDFIRERNGAVTESFGLDRSVRNVDVVVGRVHELVPAGTEWVECEPDETAADCVDASNPIPVTTDDDEHCGLVAALRQDPVPYAYAGRTNSMPVQWVLLDITCEG